MTTATITNSTKGKPPVQDLIWDLRPETWAEVCGNEEVVRRLQGYCTSGAPPKQILLVSPPGGGKTTLARLTAKSMACSGRSAAEPEPCGSCASCREFCGRLQSNSTVYLDPEMSNALFTETLTDTIYGRLVFTETRRPVPLIADDLDEFTMARQKKLKRLMDMAWQGFMIACSTNPDGIEKALRHRFHRLALVPPTVDEVADWAGRMATRAGIAVTDKDALRVLAMRGGCNFRSVLSILQPLRDLRHGLDVRSVEEAARTAGYA